MAEQKKPSKIQHRPQGLVNRAAGSFLLAYMLPMLLLIMGAIALRYRKMPITTIEMAEKNPTKLLRLKVTRNGGLLDRFMEQSRLNLLPQLANVARGEISIFMAFR